MSETTDKLYIEHGIFAAAKLNDPEALALMFQQFIGPDEQIQFCEYMGQYGIVIMVTHSFICITEKRVISLQIGSFGEIIYQDAFIEYLNSGLIYQPSILGLYIISIIAVVSTLGIGILLIPFIVKAYYKLYKCGLVYIIKEGLQVYVFVNRNRMSRANTLWRLTAEVRENRIKQIPQIV
ncbi:MAG: hypothetical protein JWQ09_4561 [Segetibacter sp.]|nr:hypothetical protein [Segetibacter sp.]